MNTKYFYFFRLVTLKKQPVGHLWLATRVFVPHKFTHCALVCSVLCHHYANYMAACNGNFSLSVI